jgi:hypothetical protein
VLSWIKDRENFEKQLLDEMTLLVYEGKFSEHYIENLPVYKRKHLIKTITDVLDKKAAAANPDSGNLLYDRSRME